VSVFRGTEVAGDNKSKSGKLGVLIHFTAGWADMARFVAEGGIFISSAISLQTGKLFAVQGLKAYVRSGEISLAILKLGNRWRSVGSLNLTSRYPGGKASSTSELEVAWGCKARVAGFEKKKEIFFPYRDQNASFLYTVVLSAKAKKTDRLCSSAHIKNSLCHPTLPYWIHGLMLWKKNNLPSPCG
jgi:hypothetical protein